MKIKIRYIFLGLLLLLVMIMSLNYSGMCVSRLSWLSKEERVQNSLDFWSNLDRVYVKSERKYVKQIDQVDQEEYYKKNPDCCRVGRAGVSSYNPFFLDRVLGINNGFFTKFKYKVTFINSKGSKTSEVLEYEAFQTNCGKILTD